MYLVPRHATTRCSAAVSAAARPAIATRPVMTVFADPSCRTPRCPLSVLRPPPGSFAFEDNRHVRRDAVRRDLRSPGGDEPAQAVRKDGGIRGTLAPPTEGRRGSGGGHGYVLTRGQRFERAGRKTAGTSARRLGGDPLCEADDDDLSEARRGSRWSDEGARPDDHRRRRRLAQRGEQANKLAGDISFGHGQPARRRRARTPGGGRGPAAKWSQ